MGAARPIDLAFRIGARSLGGFRRRLVPIGLSLEEALADRPPVLPALPGEADGYVLRALPARWAGAVAGRGLRAVVRQSYARHFAPLDQGFDAYLAGFSARTRSTLKRKLRRFADAAGGLDVRMYATPDEIADFHAHACAVSRLTYQERLLDAGMPSGPAAAAGLAAAAAGDAVRGFILFARGQPVAYLHAPAEGRALRYAHLGHDPGHAALSPGTVLQMEAMRLLMAERRFAWFDFTEGEGAHKALFGREAISSLDLMLLRPTLANRAAFGALGAFDGAVARGRAAAARLGVETLARRLAR